MAKKSKDEYKWLWNDPDHKHYGYTLEATYQAYVKKYMKTAAYAESVGARPNEPFMSMKEFKGEFEEQMSAIISRGQKPSSKLKIAEKLATDQVYKESQKSAALISDALKNLDLGGKKLTVREIRAGGTENKEFHTMIKEDIAKLREQGLKGRALRQIITDRYYNGGSQ